MRYSFDYKRKCIEIYREGKWPESPEGTMNSDRFHHKIRELRYADAAKVID